MSAFKMSRRLVLASAALIGFGALPAPASAQQLEKVIYLFPAPPVLPAFGPIRLAQGKGYFKDAGLDVEFQVGRGGCNQQAAGHFERGHLESPVDENVADGLPIDYRRARRLPLYSTRLAWNMQEADHFSAPPGRV